MGIIRVIFCSKPETKPLTLTAKNLEFSLYHETCRVNLQFFFLQYVPQNMIPEMNGMETIHEKNYVTYE